MIGPASKVKAGGYKSNVGYNLFSVFKTSEDNWNFPRLFNANDPNVVDLADFFTEGVPPPPTPALNISANKGTPGSTTTATGTGFPPSASVNLIWDCSSAACTSTKTLGTATADANGNFTKAVTVPAHADAKWHALGARAIGAFAVRWYQILPKVTLSPTSGTTSSSTTVNGVGFAANENVNVLWNCRSANSRATRTWGRAVANADGDFSRVVTVPAHVPERLVRDRGQGRDGHIRGRVVQHQAELRHLAELGTVRLDSADHRDGAPGGTITFRWNCAWGRVRQLAIARDSDTHLRGRPEPQHHDPERHRGQLVCDRRGELRRHAPRRQVVRR